MEPENIFFFAGTAAALIHASVRFALNYRKNKAEEKKNYEEKVDVVKFIISELNSYGFTLSSEKAKEYIEKPEVIISEDAAETYPRIKQVHDTLTNLFEDISPEGAKIVNAVLKDAVSEPDYRKFLNDFVNTPLYTRIKNSDLSKRNYIQPADIALNKQLTTLSTNPTLFSDYSPLFISALVNWLHVFLTIRNHTTLARGQISSELKTEFSNLLNILGNENLDLSVLNESDLHDLLILQLDIAAHAQNAKVLLDTYNKITNGSIESLEPETLLVIYHTSAILGKWDDVRAAAKILREAFPDFLERFKQASIKMRNVPDMSILTNLAEDFDFYNFSYATSKSEEEIQQKGFEYLLGYHKEQKKIEKRKAKLEAKLAEAKTENTPEETETAADNETSVGDDTQTEITNEVSEANKTDDLTEIPEVRESTEEIAVEAEPAQEIDSTKDEDLEKTENVEPVKDDEDVQIDSNTEIQGAEEPEEANVEPEISEDEVSEDEDDGYVPVVSGIAFEGPQQGPHPLTQCEYLPSSYSYGEWNVREYIMNTLPERLEASDPVYLKSIQDDISRSNELKAKKGQVAMEKSTNVIHRMGCLAYMKSFSPVPIYPVGICTEDKMVFAAKINIASSLRPLLQSEYYEFTRDQEYVDEENNTQAWNGFMTLKQEFFSAEDKTTTTNKTSFYFTLRIIIAPKKKSKATATKKSKITKKATSKSKKSTGKSKTTKSTKSAKPELSEIAEGDDEENADADINESAIDDSNIDESTIESNIDESAIDESIIDNSAIESAIEEESLVKSEPESVVNTIVEVEKIIIEDIVDGQPLVENLVILEVTEELMETAEDISTTVKNDSLSIDATNAQQDEPNVENLTTEEASEALEEESTEVVTPEEFVEPEEASEEPVSEESEQ